MANKVLSVDDTHVKNVANPSGLKKASGDSASGMDAATMKAVAENLVVNGMIDLSAIQMIERSTLSHLNNNNIVSVGGNQRNEKRSEKINELALGMNSTNFQSSKTDSLGDMMCELMVLMIQSTTERRQIEREMRTVLTIAQMDQSKEIAEKIMEKMHMEVDQIKDQAITQAVVTGVSSGVTIGATSIQSKSQADFQQTMGNAGLINHAIGLVNVGVNLINIGNIKKIAKLDAEISAKRAAMTLTRSVANSVESSLKSINSVRDHFMSIMTEIAKATHDNKMEIIRNSVI
ncbi:MAG: hypothetical protein LBJ13_02425 [Puniceicoccales bacterium]|jgi:hypothetical protein|nr:hypothetical protein [Puniceicoccales bacterium]